MITSKSSVLKGLGNWDYDEIKIEEVVPNSKHGGVIKTLPIPTGGIK